MVRNKSFKLLIYLADLDHFYPGNRISVPYNIGSIASYCKSLFGDEVEILLFKAPEDLMQKIRNTPPHVLGLSFYMWNVNLAKKVVAYCKSINPATITVIGGPSVSRISDHYITLLDNNPDLDIIILDQGEKSFVNIISRILSKGIGRKSCFEEIISGCAMRVNNSNAIERGDIETDYEVLNQIPSPYLNGFLDSFLEAGFLPQLETSRGCPYSCTYCGQGDTFFSKQVFRKEKIIYEELHYLLKHSKSKELSITDGNFGIAGERDLRIAGFMYDLYKKKGFPFVTDYSSSKVKTKTSIEVMIIMARITGRLDFGVQTLTERALVNSKRKNIPKDMMKELVNIAIKENILQVCADLIFGLPGETAQSFLETVSELVSLGVRQPTIYQLRFLPGTAISVYERGKYNYETKFRPFNNRFGEYKLMPNGKTARIVEVEEIAYKSNTFDSNDYMMVRKFGFMIELLVRYSAFGETISYLSSRGINIIDVIKRIFQNYNQYPLLSTLFGEYETFSKNEVYETEEDLIKDICINDNQWKDLLLQKGNYFKINIGFAGYCLFEKIDILENLVLIIRELAEEKLSIDEIENLNEVIKYDKSCRIIQKRKEGKLDVADIKEEITVEHLFDYKEWRLNCYKGELKEYKLDIPVKKNFYIERYNDFIRKIKESAGFSGYTFYERILLYSPSISLRRSCRVMN